MKKTITYIISLFLVAIFTIGGTYAFFTSSVQRNNAIASGSHQLQVIYSGDIEIGGQIELVKTKSEGFRRELKIGLSEKSVAATANIFMHIDNITKGFQNKALKWEIYELLNGEETYINSGDFESITSNSVKFLVEDITLSTTSRTFVFYLWLYGEEAGNEVIGANLTGYIGAETETISGNLSK